MKRDIFIGGAWPYANYYLHVGHLAALLPGDILARYFRIKGDNVIYVSGTDCHGTPITERAKKEAKTPKEISLFYHSEFQKTFEKLGFEYDNYSKTLSDSHKKFVKDIFGRLLHNGFIYEKNILQDFCENCDKFLSDREVVGLCPKCGGKSTGEQCEICLASLDSDEVIEKRCKNCGSETLQKSNKHLYFKLSAFQEKLGKFVKTRKGRWRKNALGETQKFIDMGLIDRAATRQIDWGVEVPVKGYEDKRIYVWIEAVLGYLSAGKEVADARGIDFFEFFSDGNKNLRTYYVHGKDNIPFHTIIFPAILMGLNENYRLPDYIISSAYVNLNNAKMSKSKGNLITANELLNNFTKDTLRYYFAFYGPETRDTNCSIDDIIQIHNKFLVGALGNFVNRNLSYISKNFSGKIMEGTVDENIIKYTESAYENVGKAIENGEFKSAICFLNEYVNLGNRYYDEMRPWIQVKENLESFNNITYTCTYMIVNLSNLLYPFMPDTSFKIKSMLSILDSSWGPCDISGDFEVKKLELLFERIKK